MCDHLSRNEMQWCEYESSSCVCAYYFRVQLATNDYVEIEVEKKGIRSSTYDYISDQTRYVCVCVYERNEYQVSSNTRPFDSSLVNKQTDRAKRTYCISSAGRSNERKIFTSINGNGRDGWRRWIILEKYVWTSVGICVLFFLYNQLCDIRERAKEKKEMRFLLLLLPSLSLSLVSLSLSPHRKSEEQVQSVICYASDILCGGVIDFLTMSMLLPRSSTVNWSHSYTAEKCIYMHRKHCSAAGAQSTKPITSRTIESDSFSGEETVYHRWYIQVRTTWVNSVVTLHRLISALKWQRRRQAIMIVVRLTSVRDLVKRHHHTNSLDDIERTRDA